MEGTKQIPIIYHEENMETEKMAMQYEVGDKVRLKKKHPCGSDFWEILRVGADFRLKCCGCEHQVMLSRVLVEKNTKEIQKKA